MNLMQLIVIVVVLVLVFGIAVPWVKEQLTRPAPEGKSPGDQCVEWTQLAYWTFLKETEPFVRWSDNLGAWPEARNRIETDYDRAAAYCRCERGSCMRARVAIDGLRTLLDDFEEEIDDGDYAFISMNTGPIQDQIESARSAAHREHW